MNKFLNFLNISMYVFMAIMLFTIGDCFQNYCEICFFGIVLIISIINLIIGISNIVRKNKKIGIVNILIFAIFMTTIFFINYEDVVDIDELFDYPIICGIGIFPIILTILNFIFNRKSENLNKKKRRVIFFMIFILIEIILTIIPITIIKINRKNIKNAIQILETQSDYKTILCQTGSNGCQFYNENGELIINYNHYRLVYEKDIIASNSKSKIPFFIIYENGKLWTIDYKGEKISRIYNWFEDITGYNTRFLNYFINDENKYYNYDYYYGTSLKLTNQKADLNSSTYTFGEFNEFGYKIIVEINKNENDLDMDYKLKSKYNEYAKIKNNYTYLEEELNTKSQGEIFNEIVNYEKNYYLITSENSEKVKLDCDNLFFTIDKNGNIAVSLFSNGYIPFYNNNGKNGFFNLSGQKTQYKSGCYVCVIKEKYQIIYNLSDKNYYLRSLEGDNIIQIGSRIIELNENIIVSNENVFILKNNEINKLSTEDLESFLYNTKVAYFINNNADLSTFYDENPIIDIIF